MEFAALVREEQPQCEEEEQEMAGDVAKNPMFSSRSSSSSLPSPLSSYSQYNKGLVSEPNMRWGPQAYDKQQQQQRRQRLWLLGTLESEEKGGRSNEAEAAHGEKDPNFSQRLDLMNFSSQRTQSSNSDADAGGAVAGSGGGGGGNSGNGGSDGSGQIGSCSGRDGGSSSSRCCIMGREHMFDKVVTPSDVGKLNRLVIPKQHAEKYFPLDSTTNEKGLLLSFEDRNGKPWRFRYSYWNSSQSYVMTKGWSRFVKEKRLDAGDIVSFERGLGELGKDYLYINWRRRLPAVPDPSSLSSSSLLLPPLPPLDLPLRHPPSLGPPPPVPHPWSRWYLPTPNPTNLPNHTHLHHLSFNRTTHGHHLLHLHHNPTNSNYRSSCYSYSGIGGGACTGTGRSSSGGYNPIHKVHNYNYNVVNPVLSPAGSSFYLRSSLIPQHDVGVGFGILQEGEVGDGAVPVRIIKDSVPVVHGEVAAKRVRLFGVNLDSPTPEDDSDSEGDILPTYNTIPLSRTTTTAFHSISPIQLPPTSSLPTLQLMACSDAPLPTAPAQLPKNANKSLSFNFDI